MSTRPDPLARLRRRSDEGFSLVEIIVAMTVFALLAMALLPLLLSSLKATGKVRVETQAKNLAQLRIERMRALAFHVDQQNGPFIDLLDIYYTNVSTTLQTRSDGTTGVWLADANAGGVVGAPDGPAYRVSVPSVDGVPGFSQRIYTQFLRTTHTVAAVPASYDSQAAGKDQPPSQLVSVTVLTDWTRNGQSRSLRTYTEIAEDRSDVPLITTQAQALALRIIGVSSDTGQTMVAQAGQVKADGSLTTGSVAGVQAEAARTELLGVDGSTQIGASVGVSAPSSGSPANPVGTAGTSASGGTLQQGVDPCGWASFGKSRVRDATATTATGVPILPADAGSDATTSTLRTRSGLTTSGGGCNGHSFSWRNWISIPSYSSVFNLLNTAPLVFITDVSGGGDLETDNPVAVGTAAVSATGLLDSPRHATARAGARTGVVKVLPTGDRPGGLVQVQLKESSIGCKSGTAATASYELVLRWPATTGTGYTEKTFTLSNAATLPSPASITFVENGVPRTLSEYVTWELATGVRQGSSGVRSFGPVFKLAGKVDVVGKEFDLSLGTLSCVADDNR